MQWERSPQGRTVDFNLSLASLLFSIQIEREFAFAWRARRNPDDDARISGPTFAREAGLSAKQLALLLVDELHRTGPNADA